MHKYLISFFIFIICFNMPLFARPDLRIGTVGDNLYGSFGLGGGGEDTLYNAVPGKYNKISLTIDNDHDNSTIKNQIYPISFTKPSDTWDYYILYKNEKYTGTWATDIIPDNSSLNFDLYIKPPDCAEAVTYPFIISAIETNNLADSFTVNVNVIQKENFDLILLLDNGTTIGDYEYNLDSSSYTLFVKKYNRYYLNFKVINRGNILSAYKIKLVPYKISDNAVKLFDDSNDITPDALTGKEYFLDNCSYNSFQLEVDGKQVYGNGEVFINIYDFSDKLVDRFTLNISLVSSSYKYNFPYFNVYDNITALILTNLSNTKGSVTVKNLVDNSSVSYNINANSMAINTINGNSTRLVLSSENILFSPFIIIFDNHYNITSSIVPYDVEHTGTDLSVPLIVNYDNYSSGKLFISNDSEFNNSISVNFFTYNGNSIYKKIFTLGKSDYNVIDIPELLGSDNSSVYWAEIKSTFPVSAFLRNSFFNSFFNINCFQIRK